MSHITVFTLQKLKIRESVLQKSCISDKEKSIWMAALHPGFVSSDLSVSGTDSEDDTLVTQPLEWRSDKVTEFFYQLDAYVEESKSAHARKQTKECLLTVHLKPLLREIFLLGLLLVIDRDIAV